VNLKNHGNAFGSRLTQLLGLVEAWCGVNYFQPLRLRLATRLRGKINKKSIGTQFPNAFYIVKFSTFP